MIRMVCWLSRNNFLVLLGVVFLVFLPGSKCTTGTTAATTVGIYTECACPDEEPVFNGFCVSNCQFQYDKRHMYKNLNDSVPDLPFCNNVTALSVVKRSNYTCSVCHSECAKCDGGTRHNCLTCPDNKYFESGTCVSACSDGFYKSGSVGSTFSVLFTTTSKTVARSTYALVTNTEATTTATNTEDTTTVAANIFLRCLSCPVECSNCTSNSTDTQDGCVCSNVNDHGTCKSSCETGVNQSGNCQSSCSETWFPNNERTCQKCHSECSNCTSYTNKIFEGCICKNVEQNDTCVKHCDPGYFLSNQICKSCHDQCKTCNSFGDKIEENACECQNISLNNDSCVPQCPAKHELKNNNCVPRDDRGVTFEIWHYVLMGVGGALVLGLIILGVVCAVRRMKGHQEEKPPPAPGKNELDLAMGRITATALDPAAGGENARPEYENVSGKDMKLPQQVLYKHDDLTRYTKDPTTGSYLDMTGAQRDEPPAQPAPTDSDQQANYNHNQEANQNDLPVYGNLDNSNARNTAYIQNQPEQPIYGNESVAGDNQPEHPIYGNELVAGAAPKFVPDPGQTPVGYGDDGHPIYGNMEQAGQPQQHGYPYETVTAQDGQQHQRVASHQPRRATRRHGADNDAFVNDENRLTIYENAEIIQQHGQK